MEVGKLNVQLRHNTGKGVSRKLRQQGLVPGVCYGHGLEQPLAITVHPKELKASLDPVKKTNTVVQLSVKEGDAVKQSVPVMLSEYQSDPIRHDLLHVDLIAIDPEKRVEVNVPFDVKGKSPGVALENGQLHLVRHDIPVKAKPADIPEGFVMDISGLHVNEVLHVSDLDVPAGVEVTLPPEFGLVTCSAGKEDKKAASAEAAPAEGEPAADDKKAEGGDKK